MGEIFYKASTLECIARNTLTKYSESYLSAQPRAVPLEKIIEDIFGLSIEYMRLTEAGNELGRMIYDSGYSTRFNPEIDNYELVAVTEGTILIEAMLLDNPRLYGRFRFTLAHELAHWILHKKLFSGTGVAAATYKSDKCTDNAIEWQANYLAKAILMPVGHVKRGFYGARAESITENQSILKLASLFEVSKQAMEIRLNELGLIGA